MKSMKRLTDIGFRRVGEWTLEDNGVRARLDEPLADQRLLYAFVSDGKVLYVGKTIGGLKKRMSGYQCPGATQYTNIRGKKEIMKSMKEGKKIEILAMTDGLLKLGDFQVNMAAGLEDSIIAVLKPEWNLNGRMRD